MKKSAVLAIMFILVFASLSHAGTVILIANKGVSVSALKRDDVQLIFLGKKTIWGDGKKVVPVVRREGSVHDLFLKAYLDKNPSQFDTFWKQVVFTGKGKPPRSLGSDAEVVQFVSSTDGAVGYIDPDTPHGDVKKIDMN
jgi:ABC-type phosphate transport system substrate-binding protein